MKRCQCKRVNVSLACLPSKLMMQNGHRPDIRSCKSMQCLPSPCVSAYHVGAMESYIRKMYDARMRAYCPRNFTVLQVVLIVSYMQYYDTLRVFQSTFPRIC